METITYINRSEKTSKAGKPYTSLSLKVKSRGDRFINGFGNKDNANWKIGDDVNILIEEKGQYLNFVMGESKKAEEITMTHRLIGIEIKLGQIWSYLQTNLPKRTSDGNKVPDIFEDESPC